MKISELPIAENPTDNDVLAGVSAGKTQKFLLSGLKTFLRTAFDTVYESVSNKTTSATDITDPTAYSDDKYTGGGFLIKVVSRLEDEISSLRSNKESISNKARSFDKVPEAWDDDHYWSSLLSYNALNLVADNLTDMINRRVLDDQITATLNGASTNIEVSGAKAAWDAIQTAKSQTISAIEGDLDSVAALIGGMS